MSCQILLLVFTLTEECDINIQLTLQKYAFKQQFQHTGSRARSLSLGIFLTHTHTRTHTECFPSSQGWESSINPKNHTWPAEGAEGVKQQCLQLRGMPSVRESFVNPAGDGSPTWPAAASKNPRDLDSAIDRGLLWPALLPLRQQRARSLTGCLANGGDPFHHDNPGCSPRGCVQGNLHGWHFKDFKMKFTQGFWKNTSRSLA